MLSQWKRIRAYLLDNSANSIADFLNSEFISVSEIISNNRPHRLVKHLVHFYTTSTKLYIGETSWSPSVIDEVC